MKTKTHKKDKYCAGPLCDCGYKTQHTPTPWEVGIARRIMDFRGDDIAYAEKRKDAIFIVRAVNSHEALLGALKVAVLRLKEFGEQQKKYRVDLTSDLEKDILEAEGGK